MFGEIRSVVGPFWGPGIKHRNIFTLKSGAYSPNVVGSRPTNKNNDLRNPPPLKPSVRKSVRKYLKVLVLNPAFRWHNKLC